MKPVNEQKMSNRPTRKNNKTMYLQNWHLMNEKEIGHGIKCGQINEQRKKFSPARYFLKISHSKLSLAADVIKY